MNGSKMNPKTFNVAVVVPCFEDFACVQPLVDELEQVQQQISDKNSMIKVLVVNDSPWIIPDKKPLLPDNIYLSCLQLPFNVGHQTAIACGIKWLIKHDPNFEYLVSMDIDGEDDPHKIPLLISRLISKHENEKQAANYRRIAVAKRGLRREGKKFIASYELYKFLTILLTGKQLDFGNFIAFSRTAAEIIAATPEVTVHLAATVIKSRIPTTKVKIDRRHRYTGFSKMGGSTGLILHAFKAFTVLSDYIAVRLLRFNFSLAVFSIFALLLVVILRFVLSSYFTVFPGWASLAILTIATFFCLTTLIVFSLCLQVSKRSMHRNLPFSPEQCEVYWNE
jgi:hypothetical protein